MRPRLVLRQTQKQKITQRRVVYSVAVLFLVSCCFVAVQFFKSENVMAVNVNTWTNGAGNGNWNDAGNWSRSTVPGTNDVATFDGTNTSACNINNNINIGGMNIASGYSGVITQSSGRTITLGASGYSQSGGTFIGGNSNFTISAGTFNLTGGAFTAPSATLAIAGNYSANTNVFVHTGGSFAHNNGTFAFNAAVNSWNAVTYTFDVIPSTRFYNLIINASTCCNIPSVATAAGDTVHCDNNITHTDGYISGLFAFSNNLTVNSGADGGNGWLIPEGTSSQCYISAGAYRTCGIYVNKPSGAFQPYSGTTTLYCQRFALMSGTFTAPTGNFNVGGAWGVNCTLFTHAGGTYSHNNGTINFDPTVNGWSANNFDIDNLPSTLFYNMSINAGTCCTTAMISSAAGDTISCANNFTHTDGFIAAKIKFNGNLTVASGSDGGSGWLIAEGSSGQSYSVGGAYRTCGLYINKSSGAFTPAGGTTALSVQRFYLNSGTFTAPSGNFNVGGSWNTNLDLFVHTNGTFNHNNGTVVLDPAINGWSANTFNVDVLSSTLFYSMTINASTCCTQNYITTAVGDTVRCDYDFTHTDGAINGAFSFKNNLTVNTGADGGTGIIVANGTSPQTYSSAGAYRTCGIMVDNASSGLSPAIGTTTLSVQRFILYAGSFTAPAGTMSIGGGWNQNINLFTHVGGTFINNSGTVSFDPYINGWSATTFTIDVLPSTLFYSIEVNASTCCTQNVIATATNDTVHADMNFTHTDGYISGKFGFKGNLVINAGSDGGNGWLVAEGSASQTYSSAGKYRTCGLMINKSANDLTPTVGTTTLALQRLYVANGSFTCPSGTLYSGGGWNENVNLFTQTGGTFLNNNGTVSFDPYINGWSCTTFTIDVNSSTLFNSIEVNASTCCTQNIIATAAGDTVHSDMNFTHTDGYISGNFEFKGNLTVNSGADGGSGWLIADATTAQVYSSASNYRTCGLMINKSSSSMTPAAGTTVLSVQRFNLMKGDFTAPPSVFYIGGGWNQNVNLYSQTAGVFTHNSGQISFDPYINGWSASTFTIDVIPSTLFNSVEINATSCCVQNVINTPNGDTVHLEKDFTHTDGYISGKFAFKGDLIVNAGADGGNGWATAEGSGLQTYTSLSNYRTCGLMINKPSGSFEAKAGTSTLCVQRFKLAAGSFTAPSGNFYIGGGWNENIYLFHHVAGTFNNNSGTVIFDPYINGWSASTFTVDVIPTTRLYNLNVNLTTCCSSASLIGLSGDTIHVSNLLNYQDGICNSLIDCGGNVSVSSAFDGGTGGLIFNGSTDQTFNLTNATSLFNADIKINKSAGKVRLLSALTMDNNGQRLTFQKGLMVSTASELLTLGDNVVASGASDSSFVMGPVSKIGNDVFTFPIGTSDSLYTPIRMSAPSSVTDNFLAEYFHVNPDPLYNVNSKDASINNISTCEYWTLQRTSGSSNVSVVLSWTYSRSCRVNVPGELVVARWDGNKWRNNGNSAITGNASAGTVSSLGTATTFNAFTLGSTTGNNPLPIELIAFDAALHNKVVDLKWTTASEKENDYFTLERTRDFNEIVPVGMVDGAGNSSVVLNYSFVDEKPFAGRSYYRLKQTDFNGEFTYSDWKTVNTSTAGGLQSVQLYPVPSNGTDLNLKVANSLTGTVQVSIYALNGSLVKYKEFDADENTYDYNIAPDTKLDQGLYIVEIINGNDKWSLKLTVK